MSDREALAKEWGEAVCASADRVLGNVSPAFPTRGDNFATLGKLEANLDFRERDETEFTLHADYMNYLSGRNSDKPKQIA